MVDRNNNQVDGSPHNPAYYTQKINCIVVLGTVMVS